MTIAEARPLSDRPPLAPPTTETVAEAGDTLIRLLGRSGFGGALRDEIVLAFSAEFDPRRLRPGHRLTVVWSRRFRGDAERLILAIDDGETIELDLSEARVVRREPPTERLDAGLTVTVEGSLLESLEKAEAPPRLGLDLAATLGGLVDFRRDVKGGETAELLYSEEILPDGERIGDPLLRYARLVIGGRTFEVARPEGEETPPQVFVNGEPVQRAAPPVAGARLSSVFGRRKHPVYGNLRMHTGVDYAARRGTPVFASAPGTVAYAGSRRGYGRVVEIRHGGGMTTRYAHLSGFASGLKAGQQVEAGERIGAVGSSGTATGPNLHYEVRFDGRAVDPLGDERIAALASPAAEGDPAGLLAGLRKRFRRVFTSLPPA